MPADEDYGRRQITLQHASPSPAPVTCPAGCPAASVDHLQYPQTEHRLQQEKYASEKNLQTDRFEPPERFQAGTERFGSERGGSDRLPSGERYQGVSERYPLGERPHTSVSSERLSKEVLQTSGHCHNERQTFMPERYAYTTERNCQRYSDRFVPIQNIGSLDRYHNHTSLERYQRTNTPTDRYHTLSTDKERCSSSNGDRCTPVEKYTNNTAEGFVTNERYTPTERHKNHQSDREKSSQNDMYKRSSSSDRKSDRYLYQNRFNHDQYLQECYSNERFPAIPCPERFATNFTQVPYMEPPSPAPASDRFIPPPPLSPENTPSPDCYPSNPFPSPTNTEPPTERFIPPPPLSPSPTDSYSPKKITKYDKPNRYQYVQASNASERYVQCQPERYKDRNNYYSMPSHQNAYHTSNMNGAERYGSSDRYVPPNVHMPVERYIPQDHFYGTYHSYDRYPKYANNDPYMRRDLTFHYRLPVPYPPNQYQRLRYSHIGTPNRVKCYQYQEGYQLSKSSPGSSSSSSVTSQGKEIQKEMCANMPECQNYQNNSYQQQEKAVQCNNFSNKEMQCSSFHIGQSKELPKGQCRHAICASPSVEYVGQSGGRHVCATPPPRGSIGSGDSVCSDQCCVRRSQNSLAVAVW